MNVFPQYRLTERSGIRHTRTVQQLGLLPLAIAAMLMFAYPAGPGPGLWAALGVSIGLELVLWGAFALHGLRKPATALGARLVEISDQWYPYLLFGVRKTFVILSLTLLWLTLLDLGFPESTWHHVNFVLLMILYPISLFTREMAQQDEMLRFDLLADFFHYLGIILLTTFVTGVVTLLSAPSVALTSQQHNPFLIVLWVAASLVILTCVALFLDRAFRRTREL